MIPSRRKRPTYYTYIHVHIYIYIYISYNSLCLFLYIPTVDPPFVFTKKMCLDVFWVSAKGSPWSPGFKSRLQRNESLKKRKGWEGRRVPPTHPCHGSPFLNHEIDFKQRESYDVYLYDILLVTVICFLPYLNPRDFRL